MYMEMAWTCGHVLCTSVCSTAQASVAKKKRKEDSEEESESEQEENDDDDSDDDDSDSDAEYGVPKQRRGLSSNKRAAKGKPSKGSTTVKSKAGKGLARKAAKAKPAKANPGAKVSLNTHASGDAGILRSVDTRKQWPQTPLCLLPGLA